MLEVKNIDQLNAQFDQWERDLVALAEDVVKGYAVTAFYTLLENSAQYSGDFAANWNVIVNYSKPVEFIPFDPTVRQLGKLKEKGKIAFILGDKPAINEAKSRQKGALHGFRLGDEITISNYSSHDTINYSQLIEKGAIKFRVGNTGHPVATTVSFMQARYGALDASDVARLKGVRL